MGLLRLLLALAVVAAHAGPPFGRPWLLSTGGPLAVQVFYVISGFYMTLILTEKYTGPGALRAFAHSRLLRLLPMFLTVTAATLAAGLLLRALAGADLPPLAYWRAHGGALPAGAALLLGGVNATLVGQDVAMFLCVDPVSHALQWTANFRAEPLPAWKFLLVPQAWTIAVELMFYACAPLLVRRRLRVLLALIATSLLLRMAIVRGLDLGHDPWTYRFFPTELALFLAGAVAYHLHRAAAARGWLRPWCCWLVMLGLIAVVAAYPLLPAPLRRAPLGVPLLVAAVPFCLPFVFAATRQSARDRALGELSYPVYLVHYLPVFVVEALAPAGPSGAGSAALMAVAVLLAALLWFGVGRPLEAPRQRLAQRGARA